MGQKTEMQKNPEENKLNPNIYTWFMAKRKQRGKKIRR